MRLVYDKLVVKSEVVVTIPAEIVSLNVTGLLKITGPLKVEIPETESCVGVLTEELNVSVEIPAVEL